VYSNNIVTQVLGTSFFVKTNAVTQDVEVSVRTGKVAVYENELQANSSKRTEESTGVILKPNQKVIYNRNDGHFRTTLVDAPLPLLPNSQQEEMVTELNFVFEETPISRVLSFLEEAYHIEIITENDNLGKSLFSGDIKGQNLYDQLEIICQSIQATYEVRGTRILVKGDTEN
jgi:ferric-dicitrate binding protein FerR (iron transport regulator)